MNPLCQLRPDNELHVFNKSVFFCKEQPYVNIGCLQLVQHAHFMPDHCSCLYQFYV